VEVEGSQDNCLSSYQDPILARCWWLTPVILATQKDCRSNPAQANSSRNPISKIPSQKGLVEWLKVKALSSNPSTTKNNTLSKKKKKNTNTNTRAEGVCLPSLGSIPNTEKKKKKNIPCKIINLRIHLPMPCKLQNSQYVKKLPHRPLTFLVFPRYLI
jgi:hypothetical protein